MNTLKPQLLLICALSLAQMGEVRADSLEKNRFDLSGFATLGASLSDNDHLGYQSDLSVRDASFDGSIDFSSLSVAGIQAKYRFSDELSLVAQGVLKAANAASDADSLRIASVNYRPTPESQIRVGRFVPAIYNQTDSRYVGYAQTMVTPSQEFYGAIPLPFLDGVDLSYDVDLLTGVLNLNAWYGQSEFELFYPIDNTPYTFEFDNFAGFALTWQRNALTLRGSYSYTDQKREAEIAQEGIAFSELLLNLNTAGAQDFRSAFSQTQGAYQYGSVGLDYDDGTWRLESEIGKFYSDSVVSPGNESAYVTLSRTFDQWTLFTSFGIINSDTLGIELGEPQYFPDFELLTGLSIAEINAQADFVNRAIDTGYKQKSFSLGSKFWLSRNIALKGQYDFKVVDARLSNLWERSRQFDALASEPFDREAESGDENINVFHLTLDVIF